MARFGLTLGREKAPSTSGLLTTTNVKMSRRDKRRLGYTARKTSRFVFSWAALMLGLFMTYTALHYAPALFNPKQVLGVTTHSLSSKSLDKPRHFFSPLTDLLKLRRGYFHANQGITVKYKLPRGAVADLTVIQCRRAVIVEVFRCDPVSAQKVTVSDSSGARTFRLGEEGFYFVTEVVTTESPGQPYGVLWQRL